MDGLCYDLIPQIPYSPFFKNFFREERFLLGDDRFYSVKSCEHYEGLLMKHL